MDIQMAGIRNIEDAIMCTECGVTIIGLLVGQAHTSDDFISMELAKDIKNALPKEIKTTLITHLEDADEIVKIADYIDVDYIQLHSYIPESEVKIIRKKLPFKKLFRLIHIDSKGKILNDIDEIEEVDFYFTDSINVETNQVGGTGLTHDFETDKMLIQTLGKPVFLAGGLNPDNVEDIIRNCKPYGVDVNSGCRGINGNRDKDKVLAFVESVKRAKTTKVEEEK